MAVSQFTHHHLKGPVSFLAAEDPQPCLPNAGPTLQHTYGPRERWSLLNLTMAKGLPAYSSFPVPSLPVVDMEKSIPLVKLHPSLPASQSVFLKT